MSLDRQDTFEIIPTEVTAKDRLDELELTLSPRVSYDHSSIFRKIKGWGWKKQIRQKHRLLKKIEPLLEKALLNGEEILYAHKGNQHSTVEFLFLGIWASTINHRVFVLTNLRLIILRSSSNGTPLHTFWMSYYKQILLFQGRWDRLVKLSFRDGKSLLYTGFGKEERLAISDVMTSVSQKWEGRGFNLPVSQSLENLCSHCLDRVPKNEFICPTCHAEYWSPRELSLRSFVFPSWGDFLMGHHTVAFFELFGGIFSWSFLLISLGNFPRLGFADSMFYPVLTFCLVNGIDALFTYRLASKGLHPKDLPISDIK